MNESNDGLIHMTGLFGETGIQNRNGRTYNKENYGQMVEELQPEIERGLLGELDHPFDLAIHLDNVSHRIDSLHMNEDGTCTGDITILSTPKGNIVKSLVEAGLPVYMSSRGVGTMNEEGEVTLSKIITWDIVATPSVERAKFSVKEGLFESVDDNLLLIEAEDKEDEPKDKEDDPETDKEEPETDKEDEKDDKDEVKEEEKEDNKEEETDKEEPKEDEEEDKKEESENLESKTEENSILSTETVEQSSTETDLIEENNDNTINIKTINKVMKKINLSEIILAKKNGTQMSESLVETLNETKKNLHDATNMAIEGVAIPFSLLTEADGDPEPIVSPGPIGTQGDNIGPLNATLTDINGKSTIHTEYQAMLAPIFANNVLSTFDLMTGLRGNIEIPRYGGVAAYWKGELKKAGESTMKFDGIEVKPKRLTVFVDLSNQLLMQSDYNVEAYVREQMVNAISRKLQKTILGDGAGDEVTPAGLFNGAQGVQSFDFAKLVSIEKEAEEQNVTNNLGYVINPTIKADLRTTLKSNVAGANYLFENGEVLGQPTVVTNDAQGLLYGDLKQVLICVWGNGIDLKVDTTTLAQYDATRLVVNFYVDVVNRAPLTGEGDDAAPVKNIFAYKLQGTQGNQGSQGSQGS